MKLRELTPVHKIACYNELKEMLRKHDKEFVPPLSSRDSAVHTNFDELSYSCNIGMYCNEMIKHNVYVVVDEDKIVALIAFRYNYTNKYIRKTPNIYVSTVIVDNRYRGKGIADKLYEELMTKGLPIYVRTWSTNKSHIRVLDKLQFDLIKTIENDRGEGIDTLYYKYE